MAVPSTPDPTVRLERKHHTATGDTPLNPAPGTVRRVEEETSALKTWGIRFFHKFSNDWTMNLVAMVAYNTLTSFFPLILALFTILAFLPAAFGSTDTVVNQLNQILPGQVSKDLDLHSLLTQVNGHVGLLSLVSIGTLLWGGSNLFGSIENAFAIVYRVKTRDFLPQKLMSLVMIFLFVLLLPLSFVSSLLVGSATTTLGTIMPGPLRGGVAVLIGPAAGLGALFVLFSAIYIVVPNIPVAWRFAWRGALVGAVAMLVVNTAFPFYTTHFVGTKQYGAAAIGTAIITITWFWFFSVLLLVGAQVNALAMGINPWPADMTRLLMDYTTSYEGGASTASSGDSSGLHPRTPGLPFSGIARDSQKALNADVATASAENEHSHPAT